MDAATRLILMSTFAAGSLQKGSVYDRVVGEMLAEAMIQHFGVHLVKAEHAKHAGEPRSRERIEIEQEVSERVALKNELN